MEAIKFISNTIPRLIEDIRYADTLEQDSDYACRVERLYDLQESLDNINDEFRLIPRADLTWEQFWRLTTILNACVQQSTEPTRFELDTDLDTETGGHKMCLGLPFPDSIHWVYFEDGYAECAESIDHWIRVVSHLDADAQLALDAEPSRAAIRLAKELYTELEQGR